MENDNNQTQENRAFKKEDAYETLGIINTWIGIWIPRFHLH